MWYRLRRITLSLVAVAAAYWVYALAVVPWIDWEDPSARQRRAAQSNLAQRQDAAQAAQRQRQDLSCWFEPGDWELDSPKILETSQGKLLVKSYQTLPDGRVQLRPCTMIFMPAGEYADEAERNRRAIVLRAPEGAILEFDSPFDLRQARIGKLVGGQLIGPVLIHSDQRHPGPNDDLKIVTRDVDLTEDEITTPHDIEFQLGPNRGRGRQLLVKLSGKQPAGQQPAPGGVASFELARQVEMRLYPGRAELFPGGAKPDDAEAAAAPQPPVDIACRGPFRFDLVENVATFHDQVEVLRVNEQGPADQLLAERLAIYFARPEAEPTAAQRDADAAATRLEPVRLEASGNPVVIRAPSRGVQALGEQVEYDIRTGAARLNGQREIILRQGQREVGARSVMIEPDRAGRFGKFLAEGPGWFKGASPDDETQWIEARFARRAQFGPHEHNQLLTLDGEARVEVQGRGALDADQIFFWLLETPGRDPQTGQPTDKTELMPDRLLARRAVRIHSPQLTAAVEQLEAWFEPAPWLAQATSPGPAGAAPEMRLVRYEAADGRGYPAGADVPRMVPVSVASGGALTFPPERESADGGLLRTARAQETLPAPRELRPRPSAAPRPQRQPSPRDPGYVGPPPPATPAQQFHIDGGVLRLRVLTDGRLSHVSEVVVQQNVRLRETQTAQPHDQPLMVLGDVLHLEQPRPDEALVTVNGQPAYVEARGMTMRGPALRIDQARNLVAIEGAGAMTLPVTQDLQGQPVARPAPLEIVWQEKMTFDGLTARFFRGVEARVEHQRMRTNQLDVEFAEPVALGEAGGGAPPDVRTLNCRGGVYMESRTFDQQQLTSIDMLEAAALSVDRPSGDLAAQGPGWVRSTRLTRGDEGPNAGRFALGGGSLPDDQHERLVYLNVAFQRQLTGNLYRKQMLFEGQVRTVYGPILDWDMQLDADRPDTWGPRGVHVRSDQLQVAEAPSPSGGQRNFEIEAAGNALVEGNAPQGGSYTAHCARLTYTQAKDMLVLEGDGRADALLSRQSRPGGAVDEAAARKIVFWPRTNSMEVDDARYIDFTNLGQGGR